MEAAALAVYKMSNGRLRALPKVTQKQLIATAGEEADNDIVKAIEHLREHSEGEEVYVEYFAFNGQNCASVLYYGGGNPIGLIFKDGSSKAIARNGDGDISCIE